MTYCIRRYYGAEFQSKFHWHLQDLDIGHAYIRPHTPRLNGKVERSHRIDAQEFYQLITMIRSFGNQLAGDLFEDEATKSTRGFLPELRRIARRKFLYLHDADELRDLRVPPGNRWEALRAEWRGFHSIRINNQWRLVFRWEDGNAYEAQVIDYH